MFGGCCGVGNMEFRDVVVARFGLLELNSIGARTVGAMVCLDVRSTM